MVSTMGDSIFAYKENANIWVKNTPTGHGVDQNYVKISFPKNIIPDDYVGSNTHSLHKVMFYTSTRMPYYQGINLSIDHVNGDKCDNR